jgi:hypothetical protein
MLCRALQTLAFVAASLSPRLADSSAQQNLSWVNGDPRRRIRSSNPLSIFGPLRAWYSNGDWATCDLAGRVDRDSA